jgi:hypothetical protein
MTERKETALLVLAGLIVGFVAWWLTGMLGAP